MRHHNPLKEGQRAIRLPEIQSAIRQITRETVGAKVKRAKLVSPQVIPTENPTVQEFIATIVYEDENVKTRTSQIVERCMPGWIINLDVITSPNETKSHRWFSDNL
jgi:hypothetical protein